MDDGTRISFAAGPISYFSRLANAEWHKIYCCRKGVAGSDYEIFVIFSDEERRNLLPRIEKMANAGMRVLGIAKAEFVNPVLPGKQHDFVFEFLGLAGLSDPVRPGVADAVQRCNEAGIKGSDDYR